MDTSRSTSALVCCVCVALLMSGILLPPATAAEVNTPQQLDINDTYSLDPDGATGDEDTTCPKTDANDDQAGDNPYFQRNNVARAHLGGCSGRYWYTSSYQLICPNVNTCDGYPCISEPDPAGAQWVDYRPPFGAGANELPVGQYLLNAEYRNTESRASYPAKYIINYAGGTVTINKSQRDGAVGSCPTFDLGTFDLDANSYVRVQDTGNESITFNRLKFTYLGPPTGGAPYVNAGPDQTVILPNAATLDGIVLDDGLPGALSSTWSKTSGPGTVIFGNASSVDTTATFSVSGTYVLRLTASDTQNNAYDEATFEVVSTARYTTQYEFDDEPSVAAGVLDANIADVNGDGLLTKVNTGTGGDGSIAGGILHYVDNTSSGNHGYYWVKDPPGDVSFTVDMRVKANAGVDGTLARRSMGFSAGTSKNRGLRLNQPGSFASGSVQFNGDDGGKGNEGGVDLTNFRRLRVSVNTITNTFRLFDLEAGLELTNTQGGGSGTASQILSNGGFHIGAIAGSGTTLTDYELDYFRILIGTAIEDATTIVQTLTTCGSAVSPGVSQSSTAFLPGGADPSQIPYTITNTGNAAIGYTVAETDQNGAAQSHSWLSVDKTNGTVDPAPALDTITATINPSGLAAGVYTGYLKFTDNCTPTPNAHIREIVLTVYDCQFDVEPGCTVLRSYLVDYPDVLPSDVVFTLTNPGAQAVTYTVTEVDENGTPTPHGWLVPDKSGGTIPALGSDDVTASIVPAGLAAGNYNGYLRFATTSCFSPAITRQIALRVVGADGTSVFEYLGDVDPLTDGFVLRNEAPMPVAQGAVEADPDAIDTKVWRIQDTGSAKTKYLMSPGLMAGNVGATIVSRLRVRTSTSPSEGGLYIWENPSATAECHWGGPNGRIKEVARGVETYLVNPGQANDAFHVLRLTSIGIEDCNRVVRVYFDEDPTPVMEIFDAAAAGTTPEGLGFGAGSTPGTYDIAFDWVTGTNAGAFAPGEEEDIIGRSLIPVDSFRCADGDDDGDVDHTDFGSFQLCYTGDSGVAFDAVHCSCYDRDRDEDVDERDFAKFEACFSGATVPWVPTPECP